MIIIVAQRNTWQKITSNWRIIFIFFFITLMLFAVSMIYSSGSVIVNNGKADLSEVDFKQNELVALNGHWEFYWDRLLTQEAFTAEHMPQMDSFMKVPGSWTDREDEKKGYPDHGVATYRLRLSYPSTLKDPALSIKRIGAAYKLFANGQLIKEVGKVSDKSSDFKEGYEQLIVDLPKNKQELELVFQVANQKYARGGMRESPVFGSKQVLEQQKTVLFAVQLFFMGGVFVFGIYYFLLFLLQKKNKTALLFSVLCFDTALRSIVWGVSPLVIFFPKLPADVGVYINYITGYNLVPIIILFIYSIYPLEFNKKLLGLILLPTLFFDALLLGPAQYISPFITSFYLMMMLQMIYILGILMKAIIRKRDNAILLFIAICIFVLAIIADVFYLIGIGGINLSYVFLYGNFAVIMAMSFVQARFQSDTHKKLIFFNEQLIEADRLKDKIMETEMSFLQAQIKPHFLYNALDAIANVCEEDGEKASELIVDLAIYLRGSLEFNSLDKMVRLEKELEFVGTYFNIEQTRFGQKIQLFEEIEISLDYQLPVLILQPLVENAVRHGISKKQLGGRVTIRVMQLPEGISFEIEDDGVGIESEKLALLLSDERKDQGVGLINIHHRLLSMYGRGLEISSEVGYGTCVRLVLPKGE